MYTGVLVLHENVQSRIYLTRTRIVSEVLFSMHCLSWKKKSKERFLKAFIGRDHASPPVLDSFRIYSTYYILTKRRRRRAGMCTYLYRISFSLWFIFGPFAAPSIYYRTSAVSSCLSSASVDFPSPERLWILLYDFGGPPIVSRTLFFSHRGFSVQTLRTFLEEIPI